MIPLVWFDKYIIITLIVRNEEKLHLNININKSKKSIKEKDSTILQIIYDEILTNKKRMNIITLLINLLSFYLYYLSLEGCIGTQIDCLKIMTIDKFFELFYLVIFSSFLLSITLIFSFFNKISIFCMIYPIITYILFYIIDHGSDLSYHGLYNFITFCISLFLFFLLLLIIVYLFILYHKKKKIKEIHKTMKLYKPWWARSDPWSKI